MKVDVVFLISGIYYTSAAFDTLLEGSVSFRLTTNSDY